MTQVARSERGGVDFPEALQSLRVAPKPGEGECRVRVRACACLCVCLEAEGLRGTTRMRGLLSGCVQFFIFITPYIWRDASVRALVGKDV